MSPFDPVPDGAAPVSGTEARTFGFTFGASHTATTWPDRRSATWPALADLLTNTNGR